MELYNRRKWMGLIPIAFLFATTSISCSSEESTEPLINPTVSNSSIIYLSNGTTIELKDTTTYYLNVDQQVCDFEYAVSDFSRATNASFDYGYDSQEPESDWQKWKFTGSFWESQGVNTSNYYLARFIVVHKTLEKTSGYSIQPASYNSENAPKNAMGWTPGAHVGDEGLVGFSTVKKTSTTEDGQSRILYILSDISGRMYNQIVPAKPENFIWAYRLIEDDPDIW